MLIAIPLAIGASLVYGLSDFLGGLKSRGIAVALSGVAAISAVSA